MEELAPSRPLPDPLQPYLDVDRSKPLGECWVMGHMVVGLDGTAAIGGRVGALSTPPDQSLFRRMRQVADVVLVGAETIRREGYGPLDLDDEAVAARVAAGRTPTPPLAVVSQSLRLDWSSRLFNEAPAHARTLVVTCAQTDPGRLAQARAVADVIVAGEDTVDPRRAVAALAALGHRVVVCEGGPHWLGHLVAAGRLDELCLTIAPLMGGDALPVVVTPAGAGVTAFTLRHVLAEQGTLFLRYEAGDR